MRKTLTLLGLLLILVSTTAAQDSERPYAYGEITDLKGRTKVYVDTGADTKNRENIINDLRKSKLGFEIVDGTDNPEVVLTFGTGAARDIVWTTSVASRVIEQPTGSGGVWVFARAKLRLVLSFQDTRNSKFERSPVSNFTREFLKAYKKGNGIK